MGYCAAIPSHNLKVAGSNPAPATTEFSPAFRFTSKLNQGRPMRGGLFLCPDQMPAGGLTKRVPGRRPPSISFGLDHLRSEEQTSELQSLMRISYAVFHLNKQNITKPYNHNSHKFT